LKASAISSGSLTFSFYKERWYLLPDDVIHNHINFTWNKEESPDQWKECITASIYNKGDKTDCCNYRRTSLLSPSCKISWINIVGFDITDQIFCIFFILEKKWKYNGKVLSSSSSYASRIPTIH
jgi:hypothetical protein